MKERASSKDNGSKPNMLLKTLRSSLAVVLLSIALVAAFAFALTKQWLGVESIGTINLVIKLLCALAAALLNVLRCESRAWLWGAAAGAGYMLITFMVFSLISAEFDIGAPLLIDIAMCAICGAVTGIVRNLKG